MSVNCHIGINSLNDGKFYGLRLYKKTGSGSWTLVSGAQGNVISDSGVDADDACWISDNMGSGWQTNSNNLITDLGGSYLDTPQHQQYITFYWKIKLGTS